MPDLTQEDWNTDTVITSDIKLCEFYIKVTDTYGKATNWLYKDETVSKLNQ